MENREVRLTERCNILAKTVLAIKPVYGDKEVTDTQRQLIETMIGAALWYLPQSHSHWTGKVSKTLLQNFHPASGIEKPKMTKDHCYPRKLAAYRLLKENWYRKKNPGSELKSLYDREFGKFNYISSEENRRLMPHQRSGKFSSTTKAYRAANIDLVKVDRNVLRLIKARNKATIEALLKGP